MEKEFIEVINNHRALIYKVCNLYCKDAEGGKDLFQEVVLQLWKSFPGFRVESAYSTWIYRVALNTAISNLRKESAKPERRSIGMPEFEIPDMTLPSYTDDHRSLLNTAIRELSEIEKAVILLYLEEKSYEEISTIIGISIGNVGVRINRIKNKLSKLIKADEYEY